MQSGHAISQKGMSDVQNEPKHEREMKTPIQEAIEKVQSLRQIDAVINPIGVIESILSNMLEKEKETMVDFAYKCRNIMAADHFAINHWYDKTFNTKER
jgi:hypothetical protein